MRTAVTHPLTEQQTQAHDSPHSCHGSIYYHFSSSPMQMGSIKPSLNAKENRPNPCTQIDTSSMVVLEEHSAFYPAQVMKTADGKVKQREFTEKITIKWHFPHSFSEQILLLWWPLFLLLFIFNQLHKKSQSHHLIPSNSLCWVLMRFSNTSCSCFLCLETTQPL